jgi:HEAT repeats
MESPEQDPSLQPPPKYGSLGPGADIKLDGAQAGPAPPQNAVPPNVEPPRKFIPLSRILLLDAVLTIFIFSIALRAQPLRAAWEQLAAFLSIQGKPVPASPAMMSEHELEQLDRFDPQRQAKLLMERAINHYDGATDQIAARVDGWHGKLTLDAPFNSMIDTALNANDLRVRAAAVEIELAAYDLSKTTDTMDSLATRAETENQNRPWLLWSIGLLGNRGVQPQRAAEVLTSYLHDPSVDTRKWAVEGLAHLGTDDVIPQLLTVLHDDSSPIVRERAACSLAQSGMLSQEQRKKALPQLLQYASDPALDAQTQGWVYQALRDITAQNLPNEASAWQNWYSAHN